MNRRATSVPTARWLCLAACLGLCSSIASPQEQLSLQREDAKIAEAWVQKAAQDAPFTFRSTTVEVLVDVIATDRRNHPVHDLQALDFKVFEVSGKSRKTPQRINAVHDLSPAPGNSEQSVAPGMRVSLGGCTQRYVPHYEIAFHADAESLQSGYHEVFVTTTRSDVKLSYNHHYYVGETQPLREALDRTLPEEESALLQAACYHPAKPFSIALSARPIENAKSQEDKTGAGLGDKESEGVRRYFITVPPASLPFLDVSNDSRHVALEYGICTFDADGKPLKFMRSSIDRMISSGEYVQSVEHGFRSRLDFMPIGHPMLARIVLHDLMTGNMGSVDVPLAPLANGELTPAERAAEYLWAGQAGKAITAESLLRFPPMGPIGSFGSLLPRSNSFCGDVYELAEGTNHLPSFSDLDSVGSLYTYSLDVPNQQIWKTGGIPGVTRHTDWFGVDYRGEFWIAKPGKYSFELASDDGARLYIDDEEIVNTDGTHMLVRQEGKVKLQAGLHTIHVPYFQGPPMGVALELFVKPPGGRLQLFDLRSYQPPAKP